MGTPENARVMQLFRHHVGPREGRGDVATSDCVPFDGDPRERKGCVAVPSSCGPRQGRGDVATSDCVPFDGDPRERRGYVALPPSCGPPRRQG